MKNAKLKRLLSLFVVIAVLMTVMTSSMYYTVFAAEGSPDGAQAEDVYSTWASWEILMAEDIYDLGSEETYSDFRGNFTEAKFAPVYESLKEKFGADSKLQILNKNAVTRGEVISELYKIIADVLEIDNSAETILELLFKRQNTAIDYFVKNGLIDGRTNGNYELDAKCTTEEMIAFSVRVYEYLCYELELDSKGLFWKITGEDLPNTVYLLGTMHAGDSSVYPFSKAMLDAFNNSAYLGVEANVYTMSEEDINYITQAQFITDGSTIKDYISAETYELYVEVAEIFGIPKEIYDYLKPWAAMLNIQQLMMSDESADNATSALLGMDMFFLMKAFYDGKEVVEVESIRYQIDMFNSYSSELQEILLLGVLPRSGGEDEENALTAEELAALMRELNAYMLQAIKSGDEDALTEILTASRDYSNPLMEEYNTKLWDIRDAGMAETIEQYLAYEEAEGDFFVAVGAGHTVGGTGIVKVLKDKGYTVERIK